MVVGFAEIVGAIHLLAAMIVVGGQLAITLITIRPLFGNAGADPDADRGGDPGIGSWEHAERAWKTMALIALGAGLASGAIYVRYTVIAQALLTSTPYGPLLMAKVALAIALGVCLFFAPAISQRNPRRAPAFRVLGSLLALAIVALALFMRYL